MVPHQEADANLGEAILADQLIIHHHLVEEILCSLHSMHFLRRVLIALYLLKVHLYQVLLVDILGHGVRLIPRSYFCSGVAMWRLGAR